jgi:DNA polymerase-3 subunit epsilon
LAEDAMPTRLRKTRPHHVPSGPFVALDFETADYESDSACALAMIRVENDEIVAKRVCLIRPPRPRIVFTHIHGITWGDVADKPNFADLWPTMVDMLDGVDFLAAHNASFDQRVLAACCAAARLPAPPHPFVCTVKLARTAFGLRYANLPTVCRHLNLPLRHHDAESDAEACARIILAARTALAERLTADG